MQTDDRQTLYAHSKRPRWGFAILAWEGNGQRHYQFQDGQLRIFKKGYYELLEEVEPPAERAIDIVRDLKAMLLRMERGRRDSGAAPKSLEPLVSFDDQLRLFEALHPQGFADPSWVSAMRGAPGQPRQRRHRDAAIADARERLGRERLDRAIRDGDHRAVCEAAKAVLAATDLTGSKDTVPLRRLPTSDEPALAVALRDLLHGEGAFAGRFAAFVGVLDGAHQRRVSWPMATAFAALVHPDEHFAIKPSVARQQAQWIAPGLAYDASPSAEVYKRMLAMADAVRRRLSRAGHAPRDLLDVHDFMNVTLRPKRPSAHSALDASRGRGALADAATDTRPDAATDTRPDAATHASRGTTPDIKTDTAAHAATHATPNTTPDAATDTTPNAATHGPPDATPDAATPDAATHAAP